MINLGGYMMGLSTRTLIFGMVSLLGLLSATASCSSGQSDRSVAQIDESHVLETSSKSVLELRKSPVITATS